MNPFRKMHKINSIQRSRQLKQNSNTCVEVEYYLEIVFENIYMSVVSKLL